MKQCKSINSMSKMILYFRKNIGLLFLVVICMINFILIFPAITKNINDPNLVLYFNADEGGFQSLLWGIYSGEKLENRQFEVAYGLELEYVVDFVRVFISPFMEVTPGILLLIVRCVHSLAWIGVLLSVWRLVGKHFGRGWQQIVIVILIAVRPTLPYLLNCSKPEPLVLLLMVICFDYAFCFIEKPTKKKFVIPICCASMAFIIKYQGAFLLPLIIAAIYFSKRYHDKTNTKMYNFLVPKIKGSYLVLFLIGMITLILPLIAIFFYVRGTTGITLYEEFGIWGSVKEKRQILYIWLIGISLMIVSFVIWILNKQNNAKLKIITETVNELNSYSAIVCGMFFILTIIFGFRWIINPEHFIKVYVQLGTMSSLNKIDETNLVFSYLGNIFKKIINFDFIVFFIFIVYLFVEVCNCRKNLKEDLSSILLFKRVTMLAFLIFPFAYMFTTMVLASHHMLPIFVVATILVTQGIKMLIISCNEKKLYKNVIISLTLIMFLIDVIINGRVIIKERIRAFNQHDDIVFNIAQWWRENIPKEAVIVADHPTRVYVPPEYENVKILRSYKALCSKMGVVEQLQQLVNEYHPQFIYYNEGLIGRPTDNEVWPAIDVMLPDKSVKIVKTFESTGRRYQRSPDDKFVIYQVYYDEEPKW